MPCSSARRQPPPQSTMKAATLTAPASREVAPWLMAKDFAALEIVPATAASLCPNRAMACTHRVPALHSSRRPGRPQKPVWLSPVWPLWWVQEPTSFTRGRRRSSLRSSCSEPCFHLFWLINRPPNIRVLNSYSGRSFLMLPPARGTKHDLFM